MAVTTAAKQFVLDTSGGGTQDVTVSGVTETPDAAIFFINSATADGAANKNAIFSVGFCGDSQDLGMSVYIRNAGGTAETARRKSATYSLIGGTTSGSANLFEGSCSFITGGARISWNTYSSLAYKAEVIFFFGVSVDCIDVAMGSASGSLTVSLTNVDPATENALAFSACTGMGTHSSLAHCMLTLGAATNTGAAINEAMVAFGSENIVTTSNAYNYIGPEFTGQNFQQSLSWKADITDFDNTNEIVLNRSASPNGDRMYLLVLGLGSSVDAHVSIEDSPITTGTWGPTVGFSSQAIGIIATNRETSSSNAADLSVTSYVNATTSDDAEGICVGIGEEDNLATTSAYVWADNRFIHYDEDGTNLVQADAGTLASGNWLDVTSEGLSTAEKWLCWSVETEAAGDSGEVVSGQLGVQGYAPTASVTRAGTVVSGQLGAQGYAPAASIAIAGAVASGQAVLQGYAPTGLAGSSGQVASGQAVAQGYAPTGVAALSGEVVSGQAVAQGYAPTSVVALSGDVVSGQLAAQGYAPGALTGDAGEVVSGQIVLHGYAPTGVAALSGAIISGQIVAQGYAPAGVAALSGTIVSGQIVAQGYAPAGAVGESGQVASGQLVVQGYAPTAIVARIGTVVSGELVLQGHAPMAEVPLSGTVPSAQLVLQGYAPAGTVFTGGFLTPIDQAFAQRLINGGLGLPIAHENQIYQPSSGVEYLEIRQLQNEVLPWALADINQTTGLCRCFLSYPSNTGAIAAKLKADEIYSLFSIGDEFNYGSEKIIVTSIHRRPALVQREGWYQIIIDIGYVSLVSR